jgi:hypothetical protein
MCLLICMKRDLVWTKKKKKEIIEEWPNKLILLSSTVINVHFSPL